MKKNVDNSAFSSKLQNKINIENWEENYWNNKKIALFGYFNKKEIEILGKLEIFIENKLYTEREFEIINEKLLEYYSETNDKKIKQNHLLKEANITKTEYKKILSIFSKIASDYDI